MAAISNIVIMKTVLPQTLVKQQRIREFGISHELISQNHLLQLLNWQILDGYLEDVNVWQHFYFNKNI